MTALDTIVAKFRKGSPNIAAAFDEVQRRLVLLEAPVPPPPPPPPPPSSGPWPGWLHWVCDGNVALPNRHFAYGTDGRVTLTCYPDTPVLGASTAFPRHELAAYLQNGAAQAAEGVTREYRTTIEFPADYQATTGEQNWLFEWHTGNNQLSCAIGVRSDFPVSFTQPGRNPTWYFRPIGPAGSRPKVGPPILLGHEYDVRARVGWSAGSGGTFQVFLDNTLVCDDRGANYWAGDQLALGVYHYRLAVPFRSSVTFSKPTVT